MQQQWEEDIVNTLAQAISWAGVLPYPEKPSGYFLKHNLGEILVRYDNTQYSEADAPQAYQNRKITVEILFVFRRLRGKERGSEGLYFTMDKVKDVLYNHKLPYASSGIQFESENLIGEDKGIWQYGMKIGFKSVYVATCQDEVKATIINPTMINHGCVISSTGQ